MLKYLIAGAPYPMTISASDSDGRPSHGPSLDWSAARKLYQS